MFESDEARAILLFTACRPGSAQSTGLQTKVIDLYYTVPVLKKTTSPETNMKNLLAGAFVALITLCLSGIAMADSIAEVWTCEVKEGKSIEDVQATNSKWLKWINAHVEGGGIKSSVGTTVVGNNEIFIFVDTYPNLATWAAAKDALDSDEGDELDDLFNDVSECSENRLWKIEDTK